MKRRRCSLILSWMLVIAVAALIFFFSSVDGPASMKMSEGLTFWFMRLFHPDYDMLTPEKQQEIYKLFVFIVRKAAHFTEFAAFGASLMLLLHELCVRRGVLWSWVIGTLYAGTDEFHQYCIGTRTPTLRDVAIDSVGVLFGSLVIVFLFFLVARILEKKKKA